MGSLQGALPHPVDPETEAAFLEVLKRKMMGAISMYVDVVRAVEQTCGPEAQRITELREAIRDHHQRKSVRANARRGVEAADNSLRSFCCALEEGCRGSHEWEVVEDSDTRRAYHFTRCMWAEIFRALNAEDIGMWICEGDGPAAAAFNPHIRFHRTKTLMEGDDCCDHVYYLEE